MDTQHLHLHLPRSLAELRARRKPIRDINKEHEQSLSKLDRLACVITEKVGTMGFFLIILAWTVLWCGYNILASEVKALHWKAFDPFPAFVAYLLISNVIQILLMPLIMVGQNIQGRHSELRAENDFEINCKAEMEIETIMHHLECQQEILIQMALAQGIKLDTILTRIATAGPLTAAPGDTHSATQPEALQQKPRSGSTP
jgi:uncharacterized membrane protein